MEFQVSYKIEIDNDVVEELGEMCGAETEDELAQATIFLLKAILMSQETSGLKVSEIKITKISHKQLN